MLTKLSEVGHEDARVDTGHGSVDSDGVMLDGADPQQGIEADMTEKAPTGSLPLGETRKDKSELRKKAKQLRRERRRQKDIAQELGVSQPTISRLLNGVDEVFSSDKESSREFKISAAVDTVLDAIAHGGAISARKIPQRAFNRLAHAGVLRKSTVPRYYVLTDETLGKLASGRQYNFIRFFLFDVLQYDRLSGDQFEAKLVQIREIWKRRTMA